MNTNTFKNDTHDGTTPKTEIVHDITLHKPKFFGMYSQINRLFIKTNKQTIEISIGINPCCDKKYGIDGLEKITSSLIGKEFHYAKWGDITFIGESGHIKVGILVKIGDDIITLHMYNLNEGMYTFSSAYLYVNNESSSHGLISYDKRKKYKRPVFYLDTSD